MKLLFFDFVDVIFLIQCKNLIEKLPADIKDAVPMAVSDLISYVDF